MQIVKKLVVALAFLCCPALAMAAVLSGRVVDSLGAAIQGAYILAYDDQIRIIPNTPFPGKSTITAETGNFILDLAPGFYDVCVFSSGFTPACQKLLIKEKNTNVLHNVKLFVDPLVIRERGDHFPIR